jgi:hypothetical protein
VRQQSSRADNADRQEGNNPLGPNRRSVVLADGRVKSEITGQSRYTRDTLQCLRCECRAPLGVDLLPPNGTNEHLAAWRGELAFVADETAVIKMSNGLRVLVSHRATAVQSNHQSLL